MYTLYRFVTPAVSCTCGKPRCDAACGTKGWCSEEQHDGVSQTRAPSAPPRLCDHRPGDDFSSLWSPVLGEGSGVSVSMRRRQEP